MTDCRIARVAALEQEVEVHWADGGDPVRFPAFWLRDHCRAAHSYHPETQQRQIDTVAIPPCIAVREARVSEDGAALEIAWTTEESVSYFPATFLKAVANRASPKTLSRISWARADWEQWDWPALAYDAVMTEEAALASWIGLLERFGFAFAEACPATADATEAFAKQIAGYIRQSIFGGFWGFSADLAYKDTAYTSMAIGPHTDGTYSFDPPGYQMFHCLEFDGQGGESTLVDGVRIAERLRAERPDLFKVLCDLEVPAQYIGDGVHLKAHHRIIELDDDGEVRRVAYNNYDRAPFFAGKERMTAFYDAIRAFDELANDPEMEIEFPLRPGRILVFDNWRLLHGRRAYSGKRHLAGAYLNKEDIESRLRTLGLEAAP